MPKQQWVRWPLRNGMYSKKSEVWVPDQAKLNKFYDNNMLVWTRLHDKESSLVQDLSTGHRDRGSDTRTAWKSIPRCLSHLQSLLVHSSWELCRLTSYWHVFSFKNIHRTTIKKKRRRRKNCNIMSSNIDQTFSWNRCERACLANIYLIGHKRACR